jgi:hypothetical protein
VGPLSSGLGEAGHPDDAQLVLQALGDLPRRARVALGQPLAADPAEEAVQVLAPGDDVVERREVEATELEVEVAALGDPRVFASASGTSPKSPAISWGLLR